MVRVAERQDVYKRQALVRGVADGLQKAGLRVGGFDAVMTATVRSGSGLSSSAAVEVLLLSLIHI